LTGRRRARREGLVAAASLIALLAATALVTVAPKAAQAVGEPAGVPVPSPPRQPLSATQRSPHPPQAAVDLATALGPISADLILQELVLDGPRLVVSGRGREGGIRENGAGDVAALLARSPAFSRTQIVSSGASEEGAAFTVEARHRGAELPAREAAGPQEVAAVLQAAGLSGISYTRSASPADPSSRTYHLRARGTARPVADALHRLSAVDRGLRYEWLRLARQASQWRLSVGFSIGRQTEAADDR
jgi:hypothetical protein